MKEISHNQEVGKIGEDLALKYLLDKGYELLERNYRAGKAEIDLLMKKENELVVVEVKTRFNAILEPEKAVGKSKQKTLAAGIEEYLNSNTLELNVRFDIISINFFYGKVDITHFEDAFYPGFLS